MTFMPPRSLHVHPWVLIIWLTMCIALSFLGLHPILAPLSLGCGLLLIFLVTPLRRWWSIISGAFALILICTLFNAVFVDLGATVLFHRGPLSIHLESLCWGATFGAMLASILTWGYLTTALITSRHLMGTVGKKLPTLALCIMMILHTLDRLRHEGKQAHDFLTYAKPWQSRIARALYTTNTIFGNALEATLITSISMRSRGYGLNKFTHQTTSYTWNSLDVFRMAGLVILFIISLCCTWLACSQFHFYPVMSPLKSWPGYLVLAMLYWMPVPQLVMSRIRQRSLSCAH